MADHSYGLEASQEERLLRVMCTPSTRIKLLKDIVTWVKEGKERVYWLSGPRRSGKSTIAYTIAHRFELAAPHNCLPTWPKYKPFAGAIIEVDQFESAAKDVEVQIGSLLVEPWH